MPDPTSSSAGSRRRAGPSGLDRGLDVADRLLCWVLTAMMAIMLAASVVQVTTRYVLETTLIGPEELARYMMTGATFLSIPVLARRRNHIAVDALAHYLPHGSPRALVARAVLLFEALFLAVFTVYAFELFRELSSSGQFSAGLQIPIAWPVSALFVGTAVGTVMTVLMLVQSFVDHGEHADDIVSADGTTATGTTEPAGGPER